MRIINERSVNGCKITFYSWNNRYLIKLEEGYLEQTFKVDQFDVQDEQELVHLIDTDFLQEAMRRFAEMAHSLHKAKERLAS